MSWHSAAMTGCPVLTGERVVLRAWQSGDADFVYRACQDEEIQRWTMVPVPYEKEHAAGYVGPMAGEAWSSGTGALFAVVDRGTGEPAGSIGVLRFHEGVAAVGYWTAAPMRGGGRTSEALQLITAWCFTDRHCVRVEATVDVENTASRAVAAAAGFREEGVLRQRMLHRGRRIDVVMCSRLSTDP